MALFDREADRKAIEAVERGLADIQTPAEISRFYSPSETTVLYEAMVPGVFRGVDAIVAGFAFQMKDIKSIHIEFIELVIDVEGDLGTAYSIQHADVTQHDGQHRHATFRQTDILRRRSGKWLIIHQHVSYPIEMASMQGQIDYRPTIP